VSWCLSFRQTLASVGRYSTPDTCPLNTMPSLRNQDLSRSQRGSFHPLHFSAHSLLSPLPFLNPLATFSVLPPAHKVVAIPLRNYAALRAVDTLLSDAGFLTTFHYTVPKVGPPRERCLCYFPAFEQKKLYRTLSNISSTLVLPR